MANNIFTVQGEPVYIHADDDQRKQVSVTGDSLVYGEQDVTHDDYDGEIKDTKTVVLSTGRWLVSQGSSVVIVQDTDEDPDIKPPADRSAQQKRKRSEAAKKAAQSKKSSTSKSKK